MVNEIGLVQVDVDNVAPVKHCINQPIPIDELKRRGPVNLQRYGTRDVNVDLEEFSEGGSWPPRGDSWFWEAREQRRVKERDGNDINSSLESQKDSRHTE